MKFLIGTLTLTFCIGCADSSSSTTETTAVQKTAAVEMPFSREELKKTRETMVSLEHNLALFTLNSRGERPDSLDVLVKPWERSGASRLPESLNPQPIKQASLLKELPTDPWGSPFQYRRHPYELWSLGPDKKEGNGDDISTWDVADELRFPVHRGNATNELKRKLAMIGAAMHRFHEVHKKFPLINGVPDRVAKENGLSWRVHLLPFLGEKDLHKQFKLDEPWDSPHNRKLIGNIPEFYRLSQGVGGRSHLPAPSDGTRTPTVRMRRLYQFRNGLRIGPEVWG